MTPLSPSGAATSLNVFCSVLDFMIARALCCVINSRTNVLRVCIIFFLSFSQWYSLFMLPRVTKKAIFDWWCQSMLDYLVSDKRTWNCDWLSHCKGMLQDGDPNNCWKVITNMNWEHVLQDQSHIMSAIPVSLLQ